MKANELRLNNWVRFSEEQIDFKVVEISEKGIAVVNVSEETWIELDQFEPIKLTEEWLVKFGLLGTSISSTKKNYWSKERDFSIDVEFTFVNDELLYFYVLCQNRKTNIQYVHQLQNLYFALTGEELTLNSKP